MTVKQKTGKNMLANWFKWIEPWYLVYALLGTIIAGLIPVLLPLVPAKKKHAASLYDWLVGFFSGVAHAVINFYLLCRKLIWNRQLCLYGLGWWRQCKRIV